MIEIITAVGNRCATAEEISNTEWRSRLGDKL